MHFFFSMNQQSAPMIRSHSPGDGSVKIGPGHVGNHDELRKDDDENQIGAEFEEAVNGGNGEGQGNRDGAGAHDRHFHADAQFLL